jgi:hypothetical protein
VDVVNPVDARRQTIAAVDQHPNSRFACPQARGHSPPGPVEERFRQNIDPEWPGNGVHPDIGVIAKGPSHVVGHKVSPTAE